MPHVSIGIVVQMIQRATTGVVQCVTTVERTCRASRRLGSEKPLRAQFCPYG